MNERKNNGRGIFYGVIGVATLVVAIIGATFAYFTALGSINGNNITGNMATVTFGVTVTKMTHADESRGGMIPMSNAMVSAATNQSTKVCVDENGEQGNAVCQIYKLTVKNTGSAALFVDGYVSLTGGSGTPTDFTSYTEGVTPTTMRWAQVWCTESQTAETGTGNMVTNCAVTGDSSTTAKTEANGSANVSVATLASENATSGTADYGHNKNAILTADVTSTGYFGSNSYDIINQNYIRVSNHKTGTPDSYDRTADVTSALVFNQSLAAADTTDGGADEATMYIVVWLSENGKDQSTTNTSDTNIAENPNGFFNGNVYFVSGQGAEVTATFGGVAKVASDTGN